MLLAEQTGNNKILYLYDGTGLIGFKRNGVTYTYVYNGLGDVMEILDKDGNAVVSYLYDAWGAPISITGPMASTLGVQNPIRYRGYYYDTETGLYYLQSRYYDPVVGRFLNADGLLGANGDLMSYNLFAYCSNNPVNMSDPTGEIAAVTAAFICLTAAVILQGFTPENKERADNFMNEPNLYNTANWLTLGAVDTVKGAVQPEEPLSLQHWADSAQTALLLLPAASKGASLLDSWRYSSGSLFKFPQKNLGTAFKPGVTGLQSGVNPNTLIPAKDLSTLSTQRIADAVKFGGDQAIRVGRTGII